MSISRRPAMVLSILALAAATTLTHAAEMPSLESLGAVRINGITPPPPPPQPPPGSGIARLRCTASPSGVLSDCVVLAETPSGIGVGAAALARVPTLGPMAGAPKDGGKIEANFSVPLTPEQQAKTPVGSAVYSSADWAQKPTAAQTEAVYPARAGEEGLGGRATILCNIAGTGYTEKCVLVSEMPAGQGFGQAALRLAPFFRFRPKLMNNIPVPGTATIPVIFSAPEPSSLTDPFAKSCWPAAC